MNTKLLSVLLTICVISMTFTSCKKDKDNNPVIDTTVFPTPISNLVPQSMIDSLRAAGTNVYAGTTPPIVNGIYLMQPDSCVYDNSPGNFTGTLFSDYKFRFSNQDNNLFTILVDQKAIPSGTLSAAPVSTYISGNGNQFSIFLLRTSTPGGLTVQQFNILSGTLTSDGIQGFQNTLYVRFNDGGPANGYPATGTIRRFVNGGSGLAAVTPDF